MLTQFVASQRTELEKIATAIRILGMDAVLKSKSGHVGLPLGGAEMAALLYFGVMNHAPHAPRWLNRDRFVLSAGHGSMLQYASLHLAGYDVSTVDIEEFRQLGSRTPGHPEFGHTAGIECTTGPLGQGLSNAVGMALASRMLAARFNSDTFKAFDHNTYVIAGDGCLMEGVSGEASSLAGHLKLNNLIVLYDANNITIDGTIDIAFSEDVGLRYQAYGWNVLHADGNSFDSLAQALDQAHSFSARSDGQTGPVIIVCKGVAGRGSPKWEGKPKIHGNPMSAEDVIDAKAHLGVTNTTPFFVPEECLRAAQSLIKTRSSAEQLWTSNLKTAQARWNESEPHLLRAWQAHFEGENQTTLPESAWALAKGKMATRVASGKALVELAKINPKLVGGSADLAGSNLTNLADTSFVQRGSFAGRNIHFGVREHAMAAICNGLALHSGLSPFCATFAVFSDYMRPAVRLAALMKIPTVFIFTHDSYAVGEDGPTHQPVEHAASLRAIPNLHVLRPADALETFAAWQVALSLEQSPTALLLTRQDVPDLDDEGACGRTRAQVIDAMRSTGAYLLKDFDKPEASQKLTLIGSGSEVCLALRTARELESKVFEKLSGERIALNVRVVSAPAPQMLAQNPLALESLVPHNVPTIAIEAGSPMGWGEIVGRQGAICAMTGFGASGPADKLAEHFGFVPGQFAEFVLKHLGLRPAL